MFYGFQWKYITSFVASIFAVYFLQEVFMKALNVLFSICQIKISDYPSHSFIVHVWNFQWRNFESQYLYNIYVSTSRFFMMYWGFCAKNIMTLILKTLIWDYSWGKVKLLYMYSKTKYRLGQWICISSWIQVYVLPKLHRYIHERQNFEKKKGIRVLGQS